MAAAPQFIVIDFHAESRYLLVKTLHRKFPTAVIHECDEAERAFAVSSAVSASAIIAHRTFEWAGVALVRRLRELHPKVPIIMVSGIDRAAEGIAAGATCFLPYDEWLRIGTVVDAYLSPETVATYAAGAPALVRS